jgi:hypothetical protein
MRFDWLPHHSGVGATHQYRSQKCYTHKGFTTKGRARTWNSPISDRSPLAHGGLIWQRSERFSQAVNISTDSTRCPRLCTLPTSSDVRKTQAPSAFSRDAPLRPGVTVLFFYGFRVAPRTQKREVFKLIEDEDGGSDSSRPRHVGKSLNQPALL